MILFKGTAMFPVSASKMKFDALKNHIHLLVSSLKEATSLQSEILEDFRT